MKRKIFSILFALVLVLSFSLMTAVPAGANPGNGDVTIVVQDQAGTPIEGATVNLFWGDPAWSWMTGKTTGTDGSATFTASEIGDWRVANSSPTLFQAMAKYEDETTYGIAYTWACADEMPCITYRDTTEYSLTYNLVMFQKQAPALEKHANGDVTATFVLADDMSATTLSPKMGFFCSKGTGTSDPPDNIMWYFPDGSGGWIPYILLGTYQDATVIDGNSISATGAASLFEPVERGLDTVIAIPVFLNTPATHDGLTSDEKNMAEDYYTLAASSMFNNLLVCPVQLGDETVFFDTIQEAIGAAFSGDTINVAAGTYSETILIDKGVTLTGAGADNTIIDASGVAVQTAIGLPCAVGITASDVTFQSFTVQNAGVGVHGTPDADADGNVDARGIVVGGTSSAPLANVKLLDNKVINSEAGGIQVEYAEVEVNGNEVTNNQWDGFVSYNLKSSTIWANTFSNNGPSGQANWNDAGIEVGLDTNATVTISGNTIENNLGSGDSKGVGIYLRDSISDTETVTVEQNVISGNSDYGIISKATDPAKVSIHYNNIVGNGEYGVNNTVSAALDATLNWWGDVSGPQHGSYEGPDAHPYGNPGGQGDRVSDNVDYVPWLTRPFETVLASNIAYFGIPMVHLDTGWNIVSTPIALDPGDTTYPGANTGEKLEALGDGINADPTSPVYRFDAEHQIYEAISGSEVIQPCEAYYIKMVSPDILPVLFSPETSAPPTKDLYAGWNLVGLAWLPMEEGVYGLPVNQALKSVETVTGDLIGYAQVVSPPANQYPWIYTGDTSQINSNPLWETHENLEGYMLPTKGYWVFMINDGTLAGFTFTPMSLR